MNRTLFSALAGLIVWAPTLTAQSSTYSQRVGADTFVSSGQPDANFGSLGAMEIAAPTAAQPRTEMALFRFNTSAIQASFNAGYGNGNWVVTDVTLSLFSNVPLAGQQPNNSSLNKIAAGEFKFDLLGNNSWSESAITWNTLPTILPGSGNANTLTPLGAFIWDATGAANSIWTLSPSQLLLDEINAGSEVTILGQPAAGSTVGYLFNTLANNPGYLNVTVEAVPEPSTTALTAAFLCIIGYSRFSRRKELQPACNHLSTALHLPPAFRIQRVVNDKFPHENFLITQAQRAKSKRNPAQTFACRMRL
jgi:hypothetical protein